MGILGGLLVFLALPLLIVYVISENKNKTWLRLGLIMGGTGFLIVLVGSVA